MKPQSTGLELDLDVLRQFESGLNPRQPENGRIGAKVLGYGEISTVLAIDHPAFQNVAVKRMPMFFNDAEAGRYRTLYDEYIELVETRVGVKTVPSKVHYVPAQPGRNGVAYIVQPRLRSEQLAQNAIRILPEEQIHNLVRAALRELKKVFDFNQSQNGEWAAAIDGQISNWTILGDPNGQDGFELAYLDTSTPLLRHNGVEQIDTELFLRAAPSFLVWILRWLFLKDVVGRYYDFRKVAIDMLANFYKEQRADLVPGILGVVNEFFAANATTRDIAPLTQKEVVAYYKEDALIWRLYLAFRKIDRFLHRLLGKSYPYVLPEKIKR